MSKSRNPEKADTGKTKQQLVDELEALRSSEKLLANIFDNASDAIISIDGNQYITRFNEGAVQIFGYGAREMIGASLEALLPKRFRRQHTKHIENYRGSEDGSRLMNQRSELEGIRKDGTTFPARAAISKVVLDGETTLTVFLRDLSDFKIIEEKFRQSREELAHVARVGLLGEISASLAHELNQPLAAILTNAQVLKRQIQEVPDGPGEVNEVISDLIDDARRAAEVIKRLRALLKPGKNFVECVDLNQIAVEICELLSSEFIMRRISLTMEFEPDLPTVSADRVQMQQVLMNLLSNALDAMDGNDPDERYLLIRTSRAGSGGSLC